jgi:hypothetical protein
MAAWIDDGQGYLRYLDNKRGASEIYIQKELALFQQYLTPVTFGLAIHNIFFLDDDQFHDVIKPMTKLLIKKRVAYTLDYEKLKVFLVKRGYYNYQCEHPSSIMLLSKIETNTAALDMQANVQQQKQNDDIFFQFFQESIVVMMDSSTSSAGSKIKISGSKLLDQMKKYIFLKQTEISQKSNGLLLSDHTNLQNMRDRLNATMFGINMNRLLIKPAVAIKKLTNAATIYIIDLKKLKQHILDHQQHEKTEE